MRGAIPVYMSYGLWMIIFFGVVVAFDTASNARVCNVSAAAIASSNFSAAPLPGIACAGSFFLVFFPFISLFIKYLFGEFEVTWASACTAAAPKAFLFVLLAFGWRMYDGVVDASPFDVAVIFVMAAVLWSFFANPEHTKKNKE